MTLVIGAVSDKSIWLLVDRRLSWEDGRTRDDARKLLSLEATDGMALLGYAGLGMTGAGVEPGDWMGRVVRGRKVPLEQALGLIADAVKRKIPRHLRTTRSGAVPQHNIIAPAFVGGAPHMFKIDLALTNNSAQSPAFRFTRHVTGRVLRGKEQSVRVALGGSGLSYLHKKKKWLRELLSRLKAFDSGKIGARAVADYMATINRDVAAHDQFVSRDCIVIWKYAIGGGEHKFYPQLSGGSNERRGEIPVVAAGFDVAALVDAIAPYTMDIMQAQLRGEDVDIDPDEMNRLVSNLPFDPDDKL